jgi:ribonuclease Z
MTPAPFLPLHNPGAPIALSIAGHALVAFSISGVSTFVLAPAMGLCFDLGHCSVEAARLRTVLLSHVHQDHSLGVIRHRALRQMWGESPSRVFVPAESRAALLDVLRAFDAMEERAPPDTLDREVLGVRAGESFALDKRRRVEAFDVVHRVASRGYTVIERRRTLKPSFVGQPGPALARAKAQGAELYDQHDHRTLTYIGDSTIDTLLRLGPEPVDCDVLFLEATHVAGTGASVSAKYGHTHLDELVELFRQRPECFGRAHIVLKHWSMRYGKRELEGALRALPEAFRRRVTALM